MPFYCTFHGNQHHHGTDWCPISLDVKAKREVEKKAAEEASQAAAQTPKTIHHTTFLPHPAYYPNPTNFANFQPTIAWQPSPTFQPQIPPQNIGLPPQPRHEIPLLLPNLPNKIPKAKPNPLGNNSNAIPTYDMIMPISGGSSQSELREGSSNNIPTFGMIRPITGGSTLDFGNKRQKRDYFKQVNTIIPMNSEWAHMPITFTEEDFKLKTALHNDTMVIEAIIANWKIGKVLVDTGSSADIIFTNTFREMKIDPHLLQLAEVPLLGFGWRPVKTL